MKAKFPKYSKNSFSNNSGKKRNTNSKGKVCFNPKKKKKKEKHLPSVSVFSEGLILFKSQVNVQLWPSIIHLSSASYINRNKNISHYISKIFPIQKRKL